MGWEGSFIMEGPFGDLSFGVRGQDKSHVADPDEL